MSFVGEIKVTADQFYAYWNKYDKDGNSFIEKGELDDFLKDMVEGSGMEGTPAILAEARTYYLGLLDDNMDGRLDILELAKLLVPEENFLVTFRTEKKLSSVDFMQIWRKYDVDKSGFIEKNELENFTRDLLAQSSDQQVVDPTKAKDYQIEMMRMFDSNEDGRLEIKELAKLLPVEENFLCQFKGMKGLSPDDFESIFAHYDQDGSGSIEGAELEGLMKDCIEINNPKEEIDYSSLKKKSSSVLKAFDANKDGKLQKEELRMFFGAM